MAIDSLRRYSMRIDKTHLSPEEIPELVEGYQHPYQSHYGSYAHVISVKNVA